MSTRKMKDSGVEWIGQIPEEYSLVKLKFMLDRNDGGVWGNDPSGSEKDRIVLRSTEQNVDGTWNIVAPALRDLSPVADSEYYLIEEGDLLLTKSSGSALHIGKTTIADSRIESMKCCYSNFMQRLRVNRGLMNGRFAWYVLNSSIARGQFVFLQNSTSGIGNINAQHINNVIVPLPPLPGQCEIVAYLDDRCAKIDALVESAKKSIEEYKALKASIIFETVTGKNVGGKMKDSGVEWIGRVPEGWDLKRFKHVVTSLRKGCGITKDQVFDDGDVPCVRYGEIYSKYEYSFDRCLSRTKKNCVPDAVYACYGDVLFACTGELVEEIGKNIVYMGDVPCVVGGDIMVASHNQDPVFLNYYLACHLSQFQKSRNKAKLKVVHVRTSDIANLLVLLPPVARQHAIAAYLDDRCAKIDALVESAKKSIEEYKALKASIIFEAVTGKNAGGKMKDSGVEWIGRVPEEWEVSLIKHHYKIILGKMLCSERVGADDSLEKYFCAANVHFDGGADSSNLKEMWFSPEEKETYKVLCGDLLVVEGGAGAGGAALVGSLPYEMYIQNSILIVRGKDRTANSYACYLLEYLVKSGYVDYVSNKATIPHFTKEKVGGVPLPLPPSAEQRRIVAYLDRRCTAINSQITEKQALIADLEVYKKSLIFECVTGKREVA